MQNWSDRYTAEELEILKPLYERLRLRGLHWTDAGFDMVTLDSIFSSEKWTYKLKEVDGGYEAMVQLNFDPGVTDYGMGQGRLPEIAILTGLDLAITNGFEKGKGKGKTQ